MTIDWNAELVDQLEWHWQHQLRPRLDGLSDDEYFRQPVPDCLTISPRSESSAPASLTTAESTAGESTTGEFAMDYAGPSLDREPVTTIAWRLAHLIDVFGPPTAPHFAAPHFAASHFAGRPADHPAVGYSGTANGALRQLDEGHDAWINDVRNLGAAGLARPQGAISPPEYADAPMARLVLYTHVEVIHHGAEICLLRDLYLQKD